MHTLVQAIWLAMTFLSKANLLPDHEGESEKTFSSVHKYNYKYQYLNMNI